MLNWNWVTNLTIRRLPRLEVNIIPRLLRSNGAALCGDVCGERLRGFPLTVQMDRLLYWIKLFEEEQASFKSTVCAL